MVFKKGYKPWNKGLTKETDNRILVFSKPRSEETKKKLSLKLLGRKFSEETIMKMRISQSKPRPWLKGKSMVHSGSFKKGHAPFPGIEKTTYKKGNIPWSKGRIFVHSGSFKKGHIGWNKNGKMSEETKQKLSGINHWNWQEGRSFEKYTMNFNDILKESIRRRDNWECQVCNLKQSDRKLPIHHIDYNKKNNNTHNLISLCDACHCKTSGKNRKYWEWQLKIFMDLWYPNLK